MSTPRQLLRIATAGSVDDGKSTLIGRLLHDTDSLPTDHLEAVTSEEGDVDLAALSDGLRAEREQGITIDVAYRFFSTATRSYVLADTPGHERYTRNMFTGASNAHVAVLLIDARSGVVRQTRRHARIATLLKVPHLVAAINKIDLVDFSQERFAELEAQLLELSTQLGIEPITAIPVAAKIGDNVVHRSENTPWYAGPTLLDYLEGIDLHAPAASPERLRLPVQWVSRPTDQQRRRYTGRISAGTVAVGDRITVLPSGNQSVITLVDTLDPNRSVGVAPLSVSVELADDIDVGRGDVIVNETAGERGADHAPVLAHEIDATVCWLSETPLRAGDRIALKHSTRTVRATVQELHRRLDPETLIEQSHPSALEINDIGRITLRTSSIVVADPYADNRDSGAFILIDEHTNDTVGAGTIIEAREATSGHNTRQDAAWHPGALDRSARWRALGTRGATVWLTGLPGSGTSTVGAALERALLDREQAAYFLDGDKIDQGVAGDLGSSAGDRTEAVRRVGHLARLFADSGTVAIATTLAPLTSDRDAARALSEAANLEFIEVYISTPLAECERRDPQGRYARARAGEITAFTGIDAPYEEPTTADLVFDTTDSDVGSVVGAIIDELDRRIPAPSGSCSSAP